MNVLLEALAKEVIAAEVNRIAPSARWLGTFPQSCLAPDSQFPADGPERKTMAALRKVLDASKVLHEAISELVSIATAAVPPCDCEVCVARRKAAS
jgi:hypothetical protein